MSWTYLTFKQAGWYLNFSTRFKKAVLQAGLILGQGYIPLKSCENQNRTNQTQNFHLKLCISYTAYDYTTSEHTDLYSIYMYCIYSIHTFLYNIFNYFLCNKNYNRFTSTDFGTVHSNRTVVILLHRHFNS